VYEQLCILLQEACPRNMLLAGQDYTAACCSRTVNTIAIMRSFYSDVYVHVRLRRALKIVLWLLYVSSSLRTLISLVITVTDTTLKA
jgi:hypothetical protein